MAIITPRIQQRAVNFGAENVTPTRASLGFRWPADKSRVSYDWVGYDPESGKFTALREHDGDIVPTPQTLDEFANQGTRWSPVVDIEDCKLSPRYIRIGRSYINVDAVDALENGESTTRLHLRGGTTIEVDAGDLEALVEALERHRDA